MISSYAEALPCIVLSSTHVGPARARNTSHSHCRHGHLEKHRYFSLWVIDRMQLNTRFSRPEFGPLKLIQIQIDCGGINQSDHVLSILLR